MLDKLSATVAGISRLSQYSFLFILSINPTIFRLFEKKHYALFLVGSALALYNHRAILPFLLLIVLDLDYSRLGKKEKVWLLLFFALQVLALLSFTEW